MSRCTKHTYIHNVHDIEQIPRIRSFVTSNSMAIYHAVVNKSLNKNLGS